MFNLPREIIDLIYSFDCEKRENFDKVLDELKERVESNWSNYLLYECGIVFGDPEFSYMEFRWTKRVCDEDGWYYIDKYNNNRLKYIEYKLNRNLEDFLYHEFNEE